MTGGPYPSVPEGRPLTIAMVVGETSGDMLGAGLMRALKQRHPRVRFVGIGGPLMIAEGFHSLVPMEKLSVMGLVEVLGRLRELFDIRARVREYCRLNRPDLLVGIDSPDFTLGLEEQVRGFDIPTVHYVSPSVWAWRQGRIRQIARAVDLMLTLLPFEARFYEEHQVPVRFVGHPLADDIPMEPDFAAARQRLGLPDTRQPSAPVVALLPGSRGGEMSFLGPLFLDTAVQILRQKPDARFLIPCVNRARRQQMEALIADQPGMNKLPIELLDGQSRAVMAAADVVLLASGTATLEATLLKRPMVVAYRMKGFSHWLIRRMVKVDHIALPNLLAPEPVVPEYIQGDATPEALAEAVLQRIDSDDTVAEEQAAFRRIHEILRRSASDSAADAITDLLAQRAIYGGV